MRVPCAGMLRVKNEARWIEEVLRAALPVCHRIFVMDDHSTDDTVRIASSIDPERIFVRQSPFQGLNESRDKNWLYSWVLSHPEYQPDHSGYRWPEWILAIDGDEVLHQADVPLLREMLAEPYDPLTAPPLDPQAEIDKSQPIDIGHIGWKFKIVYLWNDRDTVRVDGCYSRFSRPSLFRVINPQFSFLSTPFGVCPNTGEPANFHCSSVPQELLYRCYESEVRLLHLGYMDRADRLRKFEWYNRVDPNNWAEDCYRHIVLGDIPDLPASTGLMHGGPLELRRLS